MGREPWPLHIPGVQASPSPHPPSPLSPTPAPPSGAREYLTLLGLISNPLTFSGVRLWVQGECHNPAPTPASSLPQPPPSSPGATCFRWPELGECRVLPHSPGPPPQGPVLSLHPCILHVAMQTRGCQALHRQWLPCVSAQGVGPWYGLEPRSLGAGGTANPLKGQGWVLFGLQFGTLGPLWPSLLGRPEPYRSVYLDPKNQQRV